MKKVQTQGKNTAAEGKVESKPANETTANAEEKVQLTEEQFKKLRADAKMRCGEELRELLKKYGCDLKAQITSTEAGNTSQVFIIDARN